MSQLLRTYLAHKITEKKTLSDPEKLNDVIRSANIDLNPHQVDAAVFAFKSPLSRGAILADEVGLGKTIEAGLIINQIWAEGRQHILILVPASLRTQWQDELRDRFYLESEILDGTTLKKIQKEKQKSNPLKDPGIYIASHNFVYRYEVFCKEVSWDLVVIDEAHRLRNVWRKGNKTAKRIQEVIKPYPKLLLTATPLQNNLMELYGLTSFLDENYLGTEYSFKTLFVNPVKRQKKYSNLVQLKERLMGVINPETGLHEGGVLSRTLRKQVRGFVPFTNRYCITEDFALNEDEIKLYNFVSEYLGRPYLASTRATQRNMMELVYRKILASSSFAIAGTLGRVSNFLGNRLQAEHKMTHQEVIAYASSIQQECELQWKKKLSEVTFTKYLPKAAIGQDILPGLDDLEIKPDDIEEQNQEADDLGEDEESINKETKEREIDHVFKKEEILTELRDVLTYHFLATTINVNSKSQALTRGLKKIFPYAAKKNWPQKAVIFTESRRTQDHLEQLLSGLGYNLILFNGSNASKRATEIYTEWTAEFPAEAERGTRSINIRKALVWKFKHLDKAILITTEAGAEGLNLQFANIVINYDLPWNPQRVEQRIGRCHRYGQLLDVMVVNFLNKSNYADQRVYELLSEKIKLFGNLFDFTDKVLGTEKITDDGYEVREVALGGLGAGLEFEKKVLSIYRHCRTEIQIQKGFQQLQLELRSVIETTIEDAQKKVIQHFDEDVRRKLRLRQEILLSTLSTYDSLLKRYLTFLYGSQLHFTSDVDFGFQNRDYRIGSVTPEEREKGLLPVHTSAELLKTKLLEDRNISGSWSVQFRHQTKDGRKTHEEFIGKNGQLTIDLLTATRKTITDQPEEFERLIITGLIKGDAGWKVIEPSRVQKLLDLDVINEKISTERLRDELADNVVKSVVSEQKVINLDNEQFVATEIDTLNRFTEEALMKNQQEIDLRNKELKELNHKARASRTAGYHEVQQMQDEVAKKQKELFRAQKRFFEVQQQQFSLKDIKIEELRGKLQMKYEVKRIAEVQFTVIA